MARVVLADRKASETESPIAVPVERAYADSRDPMGFLGVRGKVYNQSKFECSGHYISLWVIRGALIKLRNYNI